jgi:hypothetical protein
MNREYISLEEKTLNINEHDTLKFVAFYFGIMDEYDCQTAARDLLRLIVARKLYTFRGHTLS